MSFYSDTPENNLRFGDILFGFISTASNLVRPLDNTSINSPFSIDVHLPLFCSVMDPCCHMGEETILLAPLVRIPDQFWDSPYILEDVIRINCIGKHEKGFMHPEQWNELSEEKKLKALNKEPDFGLKNYFVFRGHEIFPPYFLSKRIQYKEGTDPTTHYPMFKRISKPLLLRINHYAINFKEIYRVNSKSIHKKTLENDIITSKKLQLSIETRNSLRLKMAHYFGDIPEEDRV